MSEGLDKLIVGNEGNKMIVGHMELLTKATELIRIVEKEFRDKLKGPIYDDVELTALIRVDGEFSFEMDKPEIYIDGNLKIKNDPSFVICRLILAPHDFESISVRELTDKIYSSLHHIYDVYDISPIAAKIRKEAIDKNKEIMNKLECDKESSPRKANQPETIYSKALEWIKGIKNELSMNLSDVIYGDSDVIYEDVEFVVDCYPDDDNNFIIVGVVIDKKNYNSRHEIYRMSLYNHSRNAEPDISEKELKNKIKTFFLRFHCMYSGSMTANKRRDANIRRLMESDQIQTTSEQFRQVPKCHVK